MSFVKGFEYYTKEELWKKSWLGKLLAGKLGRELLKWDSGFGG